MKTARGDGGPDAGWGKKITGATRPLYDLTWRYTLTGRLLWGGGTIWAHLMYPRFVEFVRRVRPAAIVATHITAANVAVSARMLTGQDFPIVCVPTDYEVEGMWPHRKADLFCVANEAMAETLRPRRVPEDRILITGIPASPAFSRSYEKSTARERLGLPAIEDKELVKELLKKVKELSIAVKRDLTDEEYTKLYREVCPQS